MNNKHATQLFAAINKVIYQQFFIIMKRMLTIKRQFIFGQ